jgi:hypothetical protein
MTYEELTQLAQQVTDEKTFVRFLAALREDCESSDHDCEAREANCLEEHHWQTRSTKNFLRSMEDWAGGDFGEGHHGDAPILRRVATMLLVGKYLLPEDRPPR